MTATKFEITSHTGVTFTVVHVPQGTLNPYNRFRTADRGSIVEFYDTRFTRDDFPPVGQFTGGSFRVATILGTDEFGSGQGGLLLDMGSPDWAIDAEAMTVVRDWLVVQEARA